MLSLIVKYKVTVVVAAGNVKANSCTIVPANVDEAITVGASDMAGKFNASSLDNKDLMYSWSNTGPCISVFAPGVDILSACGSPGKSAQA